jgi:hypothetical protein
LIERIGLGPEIGTASEGVDLKWRALQTMFAIGYRAEADFWRRHHNRIRGEYALVVFGGLTVRSLMESFAWLEQEAGDENALSALFSRLPRLVEEFGVDTITPYLRRLVRLLPSQQRAKLASLATRLDIDVAGEPFLGIFSEWGEQEIREFGRQIGFDRRSSSSLDDVRESIMDYLVQLFEIRSKIEIFQRNTKAIIAAVWWVQERPDRLPYEIVDRVMKMAEVLEGVDIGSEDLRFQFISSIAIVRSRVTDAEAIFRESALSAR